MKHGAPFAVMRRHPTASHEGALYRLGSIKAAQSENPRIAQTVPIVGMASRIADRREIYADPRHNISAWARADIEIGAILDLIGFQPTLNSAFGEDTESSLEPGKAGRVKCELASMATWPGAKFGTMEMIKPLLPAALLATIIASPVMADQTLIAPAFGNTILSTYPDGRTGELWLKPDGSYTAMGRRKDQSNGHWKVHDQKLCLKQAHPFAPPISFCTPIPSGGVSAAWTAKALSGEPIKITLVKGHTTGAAGAQAQ